MTHHELHTAYQGRTDALRAPNINASGSAVMKNRAPRCASINIKGSKPPPSTFLAGYEP